MGLITMGYGHLTIITMGLGNSIRVLKSRRIRQFGSVEFENVPLGLKTSDIPTHVTIEEREIEDTHIETEVHYE